jgi:hypothetical protein
MRKSLRLGFFLSLLLVLVCIGIYHVLATGGALDPKRCAENGGRWDGGIDVCHFD